MFNFIGSLINSVSNSVSNAVSSYREKPSGNQVMQKVDVVVQDKFPITDSEVVLVRSRNCSVIPTLHGKDTQEWRKRLIQVAEHNIVISGNYCGGHAFDELLLLIDQRMREVPGLQVVIIGHPKSIRDQGSGENIIQNKALLLRLKMLYPTRFSFVESPDGYYGVKKITNHTKCMVIDYGKYFIQGSTNIKDAFISTGLEPEREEKSGQARGIQQTGDLIDRMIAVGLREQDFVFRCENDQMDTGKKMYREALYLGYKWDQFNKSKSLLTGCHLSRESWELDDKQAKIFPAFLDERQQSSSASANRAQANIAAVRENTALYNMLATPIPDLTAVRTREEAFESSDSKVDNVGIQLFFTGPENSVSPFEQQIIQRVNEAREGIVIDHMYFHPSTALMNALIAAAKRGVEITIITAGVTENSPPGEKIFAPRNAYNYYFLVNSLPEKDRRNVQVYEFNQAHRGLHKKVMIVDDHVFSGSSNLGFKSMAIMGDHEMNFEATSPQLVEETMKVIVVDIAKSRKVEQPEQISKGTRAQAAFHSFGARIWG